MFQFLKIRICSRAPIKINKLIRLFYNTTIKRFLYQYQYLMNKLYKNVFRQFMHKIQIKNVDGFCTFN